MTVIINDKIVQKGDGIMAGYFPVFRKFLDSSIMDQTVEVRFLFLTLLLKADRQGFVEATPSALARAAALDIKHVTAALDILQAPDKASTTKDHDGRRIAKIEDEEYLIMREDDVFGVIE